MTDTAASADHGGNADGPTSPPPAASSSEDEATDEQELTKDERRLARWTVMGIAAALLGAIGGVLVELLLSQSS